MRYVVVKVSVHFIAAMISLFIVVPLVLVVGDRSTPYVYIGGSIEGDAIPGQVSYVHWKGMYRRNCTGQFFRKIVDSGDNIHSLLVIPDPPDDDEMNVEVEWSRAFIVPLGAMEGQATYRVYADYWCNPFQSFWPIRINIPDISFNIVRPT